MSSLWSVRVWCAKMLVIAGRGVTAPLQTMKDLAWLNRPSLSAAYVLLCLDIVAERGFDPEEVAAAAGLTMDALRADGARISVIQHSLMTIQAAKVTGDDGIGIEWGLRTRPTAHGYLGYAMLSCNTLGDAVQLGLRYYRIRQRSIHVSFQVQGDHACVMPREAHPIGWTKHFFFETLLIGHTTGMPLLLGKPVSGLELWFDYPEPDYFARYQHRLPTVRFNKPYAQLRFPSYYLDQPLVFANRVAARHAADQCERELKLLGHSDDGEFIMLKVSDEIERCLETTPSLQALAARLYMSDRTLKRKLQTLGTSYQELLDEARQRKALALLEDQRLDMAEIARLVGYNDPANFTRAFKRWTGTTPSVYRNAVDHGGSAAPEPRARAA